ncbi:MULTISPECIES: hypothetical protein [unclassified Kribbella]|uniref:hypothetical protein n=1 Tax=unclassified Kribbella TaxID=2644121 RepID=UPI0030173116
MFRRKPTPQISADLTVDRTGAMDVARDNETAILPVLTRAEVLDTVHLLEEYIGLSSDEKSTELAGTLIVRLLDRLQSAGGPDVPEGAH